jgi:hypothetical protein
MTTTNHSPYDSRIFHKEALSLKNANYDVTVIGSSESELKEVTNGISVIGVNEKRDIRSYPFLLNSILKEAIKVDADAYHFHEPESLPIAIFLKFVKQKKVIYDVHEYYTDILPSMSFQRKTFFTFLLYIVEPLVCRYFDAIITADEGISERYTIYNSSVFTVINLPVDGFVKYSGDLGFEESENSNILIYLGGMSEERGIFNLIKAIHKVSITHQSVKLMLVGPFKSEEYMTKCLDYVSANKLNKNVEYLGSVPFKDVPKYLNSASIGTLLHLPTPRHKKSAYPIKLFEYMACGIPVLASNLPAMGKIIEDAKCGLLTDPTNIDKISGCIIYLLENPQKAKEMGVNGKKAVNTKYSWSNMEKKLIRIYDSIFAT